MYPTALERVAGSAIADLSSGDSLQRIGCLPNSFVQDRQFAAMAPAYRRRGGLGSGDEVVGLMHAHVDQPISVLARWIVTRRVVSFEWRSETWVPLFQFDPSDMSVRQDVCWVVCELTCALDDSELAIWFAMPNAWLQDATPLDVIERDPSAVLHAARTDRFVAMG